MIEKLKEVDLIDFGDVAIHRGGNGIVDDSLVLRHGYTGCPVKDIITDGWHEVWRSKNG